MLLGCMHLFVWQWAGPMSEVDVMHPHCRCAGTLQTRFIVVLPPVVPRMPALNLAAQPDFI